MCKAWLLLMVTISLLASGCHSATKMEQCLAVASGFQNTCTSTAATKLSLVPGATVTCTNMDQTSCPGTFTAGTCTWTRKLCVTCRTDSNSKVWIRVQSNAFPPHCFKAPLQIQPVNVDYESLFDRDVTLGSDGYPTPRSGVTWPATSTDVTALLCGDPGQLATNSQFAMPLSGLTFYDSNGNVVTGPGSDQLGGAIGVALNGVILFDQQSADKADPFYPVVSLMKFEIVGNACLTVVAQVWSGSSYTTVEQCDVCLGHPGGTTYHYHLMSPCWFNQTLAQSAAVCGSTAGCNGQQREWALASFANQKTLTVVAVAKDGRVVYGPYYQSQSLVTNLDVCNGRWMDSDGG